MYYCNHPTLSLWQRIKAIWSLLWTGCTHSPVEPEPSPDGLDHFRALVQSQYSEYMQKSVAKSNKEYPHHPEWKETRMKDTLHWFDLYAGHAGLLPGTMQPAMKHLLMEYWVCKLDDRL